MNPAIVGVAPLAFAVCAGVARRSRSPLPVWALTWGIGNFAPYVLLEALSNRPQ